MSQGSTRGIPIDTDVTFATASNVSVPSQLAVKTYADTKLAISDTGSMTVLSSSFASVSLSASYAPGSPTVSASYALSASYAPSSPAVSASYALSASYSLNSINIETGSKYNITSSWATSSVSSSYSLTSSLSSNSLLFNGTSSAFFATTGSNNFVGTQIVTGSLISSGSNNLIGDSMLSGSLTVSGSRGSSVPTVKIYGDVQHDGYIKFLPVSTNIDTTQSSSYIYVSGSTNDLYFSQNGEGFNNVTQLRWLESDLYTGILGGGVISSTPGTNTFSITSGSGIIVSLNAALVREPYPTVRYVKWSAFLNQPLIYSGSAKVTYLGISSSGEIIQQSVAWGSSDVTQWETSIHLGEVFHLSSSVSNAVFNNQQISYGTSIQNNDFIRSFGPMKLSGNVLQTSGSTLGIRKSPGNSFLVGSNYVNDPNHPSTVVDAGVDNCKINRYYQSGSSFVIDSGVLNAGYSVIDNTKYVDTNTGQLATVPPGRYSIQRVFWAPNTNGFFNVYYGNDIYKSIAEARSLFNLEQFSESPDTALNNIYLGYVVVKGGTVTSLGSSDALIVQSGLFRHIAGIGATGGTNPLTTLNSLSDVSSSNLLNGDFLIYSGSTWTNGKSFSGSYRFTGSFDASLGSITGSLFGTATSSSYSITSSYALRSDQSISSSFASNATTIASGSSFFITSSWATSSISASYVPLQSSSSYSLSSSYALNSNSTLTASGYLPLAGGTMTGAIVQNNTAGNMVNTINSSAGGEGGWNFQANGVNKFELYNNGSSDFGLYNYTASDYGFKVITATNEFRIRGSLLVEGSTVNFSANPALGVGVITSTNASSYNNQIINGVGEAGVIYKLGGVSKWQGYSTAGGYFGLYNYTTAAHAMVVLESNSNVGIGTTSPTEKLHVSGSVTVTGSLKTLLGINAYGGFTGSFLGTSSYAESASYAPSSPSSSYSLSSSFAATANSSTSASYALNATNIATGSTYNITSSWSTSSISASYSAAANSSLSSSYALNSNSTLTASGYLPLTGGTVTGSVLVKSGSSVGSVSMVSGDSGDTGYIEWYNQSGTRTAYLGYDNGGAAANTSLNLQTGNFIINGGNVGIGTTSPGAMLHIAPVSAATKALYIKGAVGQSGDYIHVANSSGIMLVKIDSTGTISSPGAGSTSEHFGASSTSPGARSTSFGNTAIASGDDSVALGWNVSATTASIAIGSQAAASGLYNTVVGYNALATYDASTAIGSSARGPYYGVAVGQGATGAGGAYSVVIGAQAIVSASFGIAIGTSTTVYHAGSIVIAGTSTAANQFVVGQGNNPIANVYFGSGVVNTSPSSFVLNGTGGSGTNVAGANVTLAGGKGTGSGLGGYLAFSTSATGSSGTGSNSLVERVRITPAGNVGINTTSPYYALDVRGATGVAINVQSGGTAGDLSKISITNSGNAGSFVGCSIISTRGASADANLSFEVSNGSDRVERMRIVGTSGNVGIGTTSPGAMLHVVPSAAATVGLLLKGYAGQSGNYIETKDSSNTALFRVSSLGDIHLNALNSGVNKSIHFGIGTTEARIESNGYTLDLHGRDSGQAVQIFSRGASTATFSVDNYGRMYYGRVSASAATWGVMGIASSTLQSGNIIYTDTTSDGTVALTCLHSMAGQTIAALTSSTYTVASTLFIEGGVSSGDNVTITDSYALYAAGDIGVASGAAYKVAGNKVVGARGNAVADASAVSGTSTTGGEGFADATEFNNFVSGVNSIKDQLNALLAELRATGGHGLIPD